MGAQFARVGPDVPVKVGERRELGIDLAAAHVFDAEGNALPSLSGPRYALGSAIVRFVGGALVTGRSG